MNLSCKEATRLLSRREDRALTLAESAALRIHLAICRGCRAVAAQLPFLRRALRRYFDGLHG
ncbi:MAG TPA: zf-HC2 domain-containing protein [Burkholderiales bacterium]